MASLKNCTRRMEPSESEAVARIGPLQGTANVAPLAGFVMVTKGSALTTRLIEFVVLPLLLSVATAEKVYVPDPRFVTLAPYGLVVSIPMDVPFRRNSTWLTIPSGSDALAPSEKLAG